MRILHVITDLGQGGAETVLFRLVEATLGQFEHRVVSLHKEGVFADRLRKLAVPVTALEMPRGAITISGLRMLRQVVTDFQPDVVQTRLDHANLVGGLAARITAHAPCVWAVHSSDLGALRASWKTRLVRGICARLSKLLPAAITSDAVSSADLHVKSGFAAEKFVVIPNGVDAAMFRPDESARQRVRAEWGVAREAAVLGCVARWDPAKDHENLLGAIAHRRQSGAEAVPVVLVGRGMTPDNAELRAMIEKFAVADSVILAGPSSDVPSAMCALDVHVLASRSESQPVAVLEAMACGVPCVVTDVGDAASVVGETGWVVPPRDPHALGDAIGKAVAAIPTPEFAQRRRACRERVVNTFSLERMAAAYAMVWRRARG
jgi:glycosyltransferase involved in cell wall biosynthesis